MAETLAEQRFILLGGAVAVFNALEQRYAGLDITKLTAQEFSTNALEEAQRLSQEGAIRSTGFIIPQLHIIAQKIGGAELGRAVKLEVSKAFLMESV